MERSFDVTLCNTASAEKALLRQANLEVGLCQVISIVGDDPPEWIPLLPAGDLIEALDGRVWRNLDPQGVIDRFEQDPRDVPVDWEHAQEVKAPWGDQAPAAGWVVAMELRDGAIWGKVDWTERGAESVTSKEYRYISPAFTREFKNADDEIGSVYKIKSAALVNQPALDMPAVAREQNTNQQIAAHQEKDGMDKKELLALLGLAENATDDEIKSAVQTYQDAQSKAGELEAELETARAKEKDFEVQLTNARKANPSLEKFVPRGDYDAVVARAKTAEDKLGEQAQEQHKNLVDAEIAAALKAGKITPATKDFYVDACSNVEGLERFRKFVKDAAAVGDPSDLETRSTPDSGGSALTAEERKICELCQISEESYLATKKEELARQA